MGKGILWAVGIAAIVIIAGVFGAYTNQFSEHALGGPAEWGMFGDYVGGLANPLLSFLTIFLLIVSLYFQTQELAATRDELAQSKEAMQKANKLHDTNITLQTRNHLRPQLQEHFETCLSRLDRAIGANRSVLFDGKSIQVSIKSLSKILNQEAKHMPNAAIHEQWNPEWKGGPWSIMATDTRESYLDAVEGLIGLIEYSDSELTIDLAIDRLAERSRVISAAHLYNDAELDLFDEKILDANESRQRCKLPELHKRKRAQ